MNMHMNEKQILNAISSQLQLPRHQWDITGMANYQPRLFHEHMRVPIPRTGVDKIFFSAHSDEKFASLDSLFTPFLFVLHSQSQLVRSLAPLYYFLDSYNLTILPVEC